MTSGFYIEDNVSNVQINQTQFPQYRYIVRAFFWYGFQRFEICDFSGENNSLRTIKSIFFAKDGIDLDGNVSRETFIDMVKETFREYNITEFEQIGPVKEEVFELAKQYLPN